MTATTAPKSNPHLFFVAGEAAGAPGLAASRCRECGRHTIGRVTACSHCLGRNLDLVAAGQRATMVDFSIVHQPAGGFAAPYAIGAVQTSEGMTLFAPIAGGPGRFAVGQPLEFGIHSGEDGRTTAFAYHVIEGVQP